MDKPITYCTAVYPAGRTIEVHSKHQEWTDWAARACNCHEALVAALQKGRQAAHAWRNVCVTARLPSADANDAVNSIEAALALAHTAQANT